MTTKEFRPFALNNQMDDPRIRDAVVQAAVTAGLKAPPRIEDFCRAVLAAALPLIELAPAATATPPASPERRRELLRKSRDFARAVSNEIIVHGFDNDEGIEKVIRGYQDQIAARVYDLVEGLLNSQSLSASCETGKAPADLNSDPGDDHGLYFSGDEVAVVRDEAEPFDPRDVAVFWSFGSRPGMSIRHSVEPITPAVLERLRHEIIKEEGGLNVLITGWQRFEA